ncbi:NXPE family member 3-like [Ylistrum balloti]|uniref:NXPE family member 3-like n=1 Tax=Ylistrum balloti TaxID=509963 RepID=UPI002905E7D3|nr:NXPE family member 3-like [Ylistrum balloti]
MCLFSILLFKKIWSDSAFAKLPTYGIHGKDEKRPSILISHTDMNFQKSSSGTEEIDIYQKMNVTNDNIFLSVRLSEILVLPTTFPLRIGDTLRIRIRLFGTDGKPVSTGGDFLRVWLKETKIKANVNGYVLDHRNGSYTGVLLLPWKGRPEVIVSVANSRHHISLIMKYVNEHGLLQMMASQFIDPSGRYKEETQCSPKHDAILKGCTLADRCNLTKQNYGLPWFCCKPKSTFVTCKDMKTVKANKTSMISDLTRHISTYKKHQRFSSFKIQVKERIGYPEYLPSPPRPCQERMPKATWNDITPVGYYFKNTWINRKCTLGTSRPDTCLDNKRFVVLGDSNSRSVYSIFCSKTKSKTLTDHYTKEKPWHKLLMARNIKRNIDLMWAPHNPPFYVGPHQPLDTMRSVGNWLDRTPHDKPIIVIIHLYYHLTRTTLSVFRALVKDARAGVDRLLRRAPDSTVIIQGPHSITYKDSLEPLDYIRRRHEDIWFQEFMGIHNKVFYIDNWDRTVGNENVDAHPPTNTMTDVTDEMLSYICRDVV